MSDKNKKQNEELSQESSYVFTSIEEDNEKYEKDLSYLLYLIDSKNISELKNFVENQKPVDIAYLINDMKSEKNIVFFFKTLPSDITAEIFSYLDSDQQEKIVKAFTNKEVQEIIKEMAIDDIVDFVEELPSNLVEKVIKATSPDDRKLVNALLNYKEDTAGSIMTPEYVTLKSDSTAEEAIRRIRSIGKSAETISTLFIIDRTRKLIGVLYLSDLIFADEKERIENIMNDDFLSVYSETDQEDVAKLIKKYDINVVPVVDKEHRILGIITIDDIIDVIESENTEDISKLAGVAPIETNYVRTSPWIIAKGRIPWLMILLISGTFTGLILSSFESALAVLPVLVAFIPVMMGTSGNAGSQTNTVINRAMSLNQVTTHDYALVLWKEFRVALITGAIVATTNFFWVWFELVVGIISYTQNGNLSLTMISFLVSLTMFIMIVIAKCIGCSLPILAKKIHLDPATVSGPAMSTLLDITTLMIYFILAKLIFKI